MLLICAGASMSPSSVPLCFCPSFIQYGYLKTEQRKGQFAMPPSDDGLGAVSRAVVEGQGDANHCHEQRRAGPPD